MGWKISKLVQVNIVRKFPALFPQLLKIVDFPSFLGLRNLVIPATLRIH